MRIALVGAGGTGKSTLARELAEHLRRQGHTDVLIADGTALMEAIHTGAIDPGDRLLCVALERQRAYDMTLVTGLDLPCTGQGAGREDQLIRTLLAGAGVPFRVVYGSGEDRVRNALAALPDALAVRPATPQRAWQWQCEKCSDPECEHRLFTSLLR